MLSGDLGKVSEELLKGYLSALYGHVYGFGASKGPLLKHQNTKTALYRLLKSHWVIALFKFFLVRQKKLLVTVLLDHPVKQEQFVRKVREIESGS